MPFALFGCEKENFEPIPKPHINKIMVPIEWYKKASDTVTKAN